MIPVFTPVPILTATVAPTKLVDIITSLGSNANLRVCLDAGDSNSYASGAQWLDVSGQGSNFYLGNTSGSDAHDPTFHGTPGNLSVNEYFSLDGGDDFTLVPATPAWLNAFHHVGGKFTLLAWVFVPTITSPGTQFFGGLGNVNSTVQGAGIAFSSSISVSYGIGIDIEDNIANVYSKAAVALCTPNTWNLMAVALDMTAGTVDFQVNGTNEPYTSQTIAPTRTDPAESQLQIATNGGDFEPDSAGTRWGELAIWDRALSAAELAALWTATRVRWGV